MKVAVLPIYPKDEPRVTQWTRQEIEARFEDAKKYFAEQSGGRESLEYQVFDWYKLRLTGAEADAMGFQAGDSIVPHFEADKSISLSNFSHFVLLIDKSNSHAGAWKPNDPSFRYCHLSAQDLTPALLAHELGHLAGAGHGNLRTPLKDIEYGDTFCVMGGEDFKFRFTDQLGAHGPGMTGSMLRACGWLDFNLPSVAVDLGLKSQQPAEAVVELAPLHGAPAPNGRGRPVVAWSDGLVANQRLSLEFRMMNGWDAQLPKSGSAPGWIVAHLTDGGGLGASAVLIGAIGASPGATLQLPDASATVTVLSVGPDGVSLKVQRRARYILSGGAGVIYAIGDSGDLMWFRHEGRGDGTFKWVDNNPRLVGTGWKFEHVFDGGDGILYAINANHDLLWFRHDGRDDGSVRWALAEGRKVGDGWKVKRVFSGGDGVIYAINAANELLWFRHDGRQDGSFRWTDNAPRKVGDGWGFKHVFSGGQGVIYAINDDDDLLWFRHDGREDGSFRWADTGGRKVGDGWKVTHAFSDGEGVIYALNDAGDLLWFRHDGRTDGTFRWTDNSPRKVGIGWNLGRRGDPGESAIYAIDNSSRLLWFCHDGREDGSFRWRLDQPRVAGIGWDVKHVFSGENGVIYTIDGSGDMLWKRHDGQVNGGFHWTEGPKDENGKLLNCGVGWIFRHVFAGPDGVIYAINDAGELLWFRHEGRDDGSFRWADPEPRRVGIGWNVKHAFTGGDGVIYAINAANDLLWFRHDGYEDGSFRWSDNDARKVGSGWDVKRVFSAGDGVIYAVNAANDLLWFRHEGRHDGSFRWTDNNFRKVGVGWDFKQIFGG